MGLKIQLLETCRVTCGAPTSPATPLETHLASPNRVLVEGPGRALVPHGPGGPLLRCNLALQSESMGYSCARFPPPDFVSGRGPSSRRSQSQFFLAPKSHFCNKN